MILSGVSVSILADWKGRRIALLVSVLVTAGAMSLMGLAPNMLVCCALFFVAGFGFAAQEIVSYVYSAEISGRRFRNHSMVALNIIWGGSQVLLGFLFNFVSYWRFVFVFVIGLPSAGALLLAYFFLDETPRYFVSQLQFEVRVGEQEAKKVFQRMAAVNMRPPFLFRLNRETEIENEKFFCLKKDEEVSVVSLLSGRHEAVHTNWKEKMGEIMASRPKTNL